MKPLVTRPTLVLALGVMAIVATGCGGTRSVRWQYSPTANARKSPPLEVNLVVVAPFADEREDRNINIFESLCSRYVLAPPLPPLFGFEDARPDEGVEMVGEARFGRLLAQAIAEDLQAAKLVRSVRLMDSEPPPSDPSLRLRGRITRLGLEHLRYTYLFGPMAIVIYALGAPMYSMSEAVIEIDLELVSETGEVVWTHQYQGKRTLRTLHGLYYNSGGGILGYPSYNALAAYHLQNTFPDLVRRGNKKLLGELEDRLEVLYPSASVAQCPRCGQTFSIEDRFCPEDGTRLKVTGNR